MVAILHYSLALLVLVIATVNAQSDGSGYIGYSLTERGDPASAVYATEDTPANVSTTNPPPDVYLNASVSVGEIDITVQNLTAQVNLAASVLNLLKFNAGVNVAIDRVSLLIENVTAKVVLEARLANLVLMIDDVLNSIDLNPVIATLGQDVGSIVNSTVGSLTGTSSNSTASSSALKTRSFEIANNILYSVNDYSGNTHTNRILAQNGQVIDQYLDNDGNPHGDKVVGTYSSLMTFNGYEQSVTRDGQTDQETEYVYAPFPGLSIVSAIYKNAAGTVVGTQVLAESSAGGSSTVGGSGAGQVGDLAKRNHVEEHVHHHHS